MLRMGYLGRLLDRFAYSRFAARLLRAIRDSSEADDEFQFDPAEQRITRIRDGEPVGVMNLGNIYGNYRQLPFSHRGEFIRACVRSLALAHRRELPDDFESASHDLRPRIWPRAAVEQERLRGRIGDQGSSLADLPHEPIGEHLLACLAYDWPESVQSITAENLEDWGVSVYEAMEVARRNLEETTTSYGKIGENLYCFNSGDTYDASRLILVDRIASFELAGRPVAMAPTRDHLLITGSEDEEGLSMMAELAAQVQGGPYSLGAGALILEEGEWIDWMPPPHSAAYPRFKRMAVQWLGSLHAEQKRLLEAARSPDDEDAPFVATFSAVEKPSGEVISYCVWGEDVDSLLPVTDRIVIMKHGNDRPAAIADWHQIAPLVGDLLEPTDHYPPRFRARRIPDNPTLDAIGRHENLID